MLKKCSKCKCFKEIECFNKNRSTIDGLGCYCKKCINSNIKKRIISAKINNHCVSCTKPKLKNNNHCLYHWAECLVRKQFRDRNHKINFPDLKIFVNKILGKLSNQNFRCAYSNLVLIPGVNCSLEHKESYSKNKDNSLDNLVWINSHLNRLKLQSNLEPALDKFNFYIEAIKTGEYPNYE